MLGRNKTPSTGATAVGDAPTTAPAATLSDDRKASRVAATKVSTTKAPRAGASAVTTSTPVTKVEKKSAAKGAQASAQATSAPSGQKNHPPRPGAKNRPTPKRKDQEAARRRPLVETDRKAAKDAEKQRTREARAEQRAALERGDEKALPLRDRGPEKRYIRDRVDSRLCIGEIAMPLMLVAIVTWFMPNAIVQMIGLSLVWLVVLAGVIDAVILWRSIKKGLLAKFGRVPERSALYTVTRAMQMRRTRIPKPQVKRGTKVA